MLEINVSPRTTNVLDLVGNSSLCTSDGRKVEVHRSGIAFVVRVEGEDRPFTTDDNIAASRYLNSLPTCMR